VIVEAGAGAVTVTLAVPLTLVLTVDVALTVRLLAVSLADTVRKPLLFMLVPDAGAVPLGAATDQDTV
jgi:hypothetical protein